MASTKTNVFTCEEDSENDSRCQDSPSKQDSMENRISCTIQNEEIAL